MKAGQPSQTALRMLLVRIAASREPELRPLLSDPEEPYSEWFAVAHPGRGMQLGLWKWGPTRRLCYAMADRLFPGSQLHILLRKRYVEDTVRAALRGGLRQMVTLGAGLDPLALRLQADFPEVRFFELDHPSTQAIKKEVIRERRIEHPRVQLHSLDLDREGLEERLGKLEGFQSGAPTLFLAEGVLMYLDQEAVDRVFAAVRKHSGEGSQFLFSGLDAAGLADENSTVARGARVLEGMGEPVRFGIERKRLDDFLRHRGFRKRATADHKTLQTQYLKPLKIDRPVLEGEFLVLAEPTHPGR